MASSLDFTLYVVDQMRGAGVIDYKKMFGEYGLYCDGKFFGAIHDDCLYVKATDAGMKFVETPDLRVPYPGAKDHLFIENVDDWEWLAKLVKLTCAELPEPKPKAPKKKK